MVSSTFRAIIVGAGISGLVTAHTLTALGIDYILLEKGQRIVPDSGAGHVLWPNTLRLFDQLGILSAMSSYGQPMITKRDLLKDGTLTGECKDGALMLKNHGYHPLFFQRRSLIKGLYEALPEIDKKQKIQVAAKLTDIRLTSEGVHVITVDGREFYGDIVIGCDGIYSKTRSIAVNLANASISEGTRPKQGLPIHSKYTVYTMRIPHETAVSEAIMWEIHSQGLGIQSFIVDDCRLLQLYKYLDTPHKEYTRYDDPAAQEAHKKLFYDIHIDEKTTFREVADKVEWSFLADQEEGMSDILHHGGRIVLVGDAVTKLTSTTGTGGNEAIQEVIILANEIKKLLKSRGRENRPSSIELDAAFNLYAQESRRTREKAMEGNEIVGNDLTWAGWVAWARNRILTRIVGMTFIMDKFLSKDYVSYGRVLEALPKTGLKSGSVPWIYP